VVHREGVQPLAQVRAVVLSHINSDTEVMLVWFRAGHPAAPAAPVSSPAEVKNGNAAMQPLAAPPRAPAPTSVRVEGSPARSTPAATRTPAGAAAATAPPDNNAPASAPAAAPGDSPTPPADAPAEPPRPGQPQ
jgi:hypothetical protein